jgi:hypothetical protein
VPQSAEVRLVAPPGPGVVMVTHRNGPYLFGIVPESLTRYVRPPSQFNAALFSFSIKNVNTLTEVNIPPGADSASVTVALDPGLSASLIVLGPDGRELAGGLAIGQFPGMEEFDPVPLPAGRFEARGLRPGEQRRVTVCHRERKLAGSAVVTGEVNEPAVVRLEQWGEVIGRVVDDAGRPIKGAACGVPSSPPDHTDLRQGVSPFFRAGSYTSVPSEDRFQFRGLVPGLKYRFQFIYRMDFRNEMKADREVIVKPGEVKDLGDVRLVPPKLPNEVP